MRLLATRRLTVLAISAALTLGTAGSAVAGEHPPSTAADRAEPAPLPDAAALPARADVLGDLGSVTASVSELVAAAREAPSGGLSEADVETFKTKIATAVAAVKATAATSVPSTPATPLPAAAATPLPDTSVGALLASVAPGAADGMVPQVTSTVTSLVDQVVATVLGGGSPALPALPAAPPATAPELPATPPPPAR
ncbi:hypothetical protein PUR59_19510 [Streptomyces sp. SP18ES09]|uniref:hypothetical protein n=1 Tax=Streptomyces sp. SP18ES09 TaxID=3002532 RepID=UPI002E786896|nr:hypothetical protein [Streptomyces sp. SP18ES09]MEE1817196.1 hypothetical protein [Streptomyces sp. SP18ES09]